MSPRPEGRPAGLARRLAIVLYDALVLTAVLFLAATVLVLLNRGEAIDTRDPWISLAARGYYLAVSFLYFGWFWTRGQTLGMRAWRARLTDRHGNRIGWGRAGARFVLALASWAPAGLGFLWSVIDREQRTWHDIASGTRLVVIERPAAGTPASREPAQEPQAESQEAERGP